MNIDSSTITIVTSTIVSLAIFGGIVKWGIGKYFSQSEELQNLKEKNILSAIAEIKSDGDKNKKAIDELSSNVGSLNTNLKNSISHQKLILEASYEAVEQVKHTSDRVDRLEMLFHRQNKRGS